MPSSTGHPSAGNPVITGSVRRSRHISIGEQQHPASPTPPSSSGTTPVNPVKGYNRVKAQWQKAVRRMSGSSASGNDTSGNVSPYPASGSPPVNAPFLSNRTSVEKPGWAVRKQGGRQRTVSLTVDLPPASITSSGNYANVTATSNYAAVNTSDIQQRRQNRLQKADSSPLPNRHNVTEDGTAARNGRRASQGCTENGTAHSERDPMNSFPFSSAFTYSLGKVSPFPCGSDAVMINSTLAHDAFQGELVRFFLHMC